MAMVLSKDGVVSRSVRVKTMLRFLDGPKVSSTKAGHSFIYEHCYTRELKNLPQKHKKTGSIGLLFPCFPAESYTHATYISRYTLDMIRQIFNDKALQHLEV